MNIIEQIQDKLPHLTRKQREVAEYMLEDIDRMSYVTLKEMSVELNITEMTILKTCSILGFASFSDMKYGFRKYAARQMEAFRHPNVEYNTPRIQASELDDTDRLLYDICQEEAEIARYFYSNINVRDLFSAADMILDADKVVLCGRGVSYYICQYMSSLLSVLGLGVITINTELDDSIHGTLPLLSKDTLVLAVSYPDYYRMTMKLTEYAHRKGNKVLLFTDSKKCPLMQYADLVLTAPTKNRIFLNSMANAMALVNLIASALNIRISAGLRDYNEHKNEFHALFREEEDA